MGAPKTTIVFLERSIRTSAVIRTQLSPLGRPDDIRHRFQRVGQQVSHACRLLYVYDVIVIDETFAGHLVQRPGYELGKLS